MRAASKFLAALILGIAAPSVAGASQAGDEAAALQRYNEASAKTEDGSRTYAWMQGGLKGPPKFGGRPGYPDQIYLIVRKNGSGTLLGSVRHQSEITNIELKPFEDAVRRAGFPIFANVPINRRFTCLDRMPVHFEASIGGKHATAEGDTCGDFTPLVDQAIRRLGAIVQAHGGWRER